MSQDVRCETCGKAAYFGMLSSGPPGWFFHIAIRLDANGQPLGSECDEVIFVCSEACKSLHWQAAGRGCPASKWERTKEQRRAFEEAEA